MLRCLLRIRASDVRSHNRSTGVMMQKKEKLKKGNIDGMFRLLFGDSILTKVLGNCKTA